MVEWEKMTLNIIQKFIQTVRLEIAKKNDPSLVSLLDKEKMKKPMLISEIKIVQKEGGIEVFNQSNMKFISLDKQCNDILNMCNGANTIEEISQKIYEKKILKRKFLEDTIIFLNKLEKDGFILWK